MKLEKLHQLFLESTGICTDTRNISKGSLFFALKGENFNGNKFAQEALDKGAYKVIIDEIGYHKNSGETILCSSSLRFLQKLATYHRKYLDIPIIALTGSNGKTTTKELINAVLCQKYLTVATRGNLNNHIGVPLTLLSMGKETEIGIVEMGANHLHEIEELCTIALPDFGYITNFGKAHLEGFGSIEGVIKAKTELYRFLNDQEKIAFVELPIDDHPFFVEEEDAGKRNPLVSVAIFQPPRSGLFHDRGVEQPQAFYFEAIGVGQQVVRDAEFFGEPSQAGDRVVTDGSNVDIVSLPKRLLQLDQLRPAPGSPNDAAMDDHQRTTISASLVQVDEIAVLVGQHQIREPRPHGRPHAVKINLRQRVIGWCYRHSASRRDWLLCYRRAGGSGG